MDETKTTGQKIDELYSLLSNLKEKDLEKKFRLPRKGRVSNRKLKKGYVTILRIDENKNVDFEKQPVKNSTYRLSTGTYHTLDESEVFMYKGKPFIIQPTNKLNPYNPLAGKNETHGQTYIMARMLADVIKVKSRGANIIVWLLVLGATAFEINYFAGGKDGI